MSEESTITIPMSEYNQLVADSQWLAALEDAGVDNWGGYDEAMNTLREWQQEDEESA